MLVLKVGTHLGIAKRRGSVCFVLEVGCERQWSHNGDYVATGQQPT